MICCLRTRVRKHPIIGLYFESENDLSLVSGICECETGYSGETCNISASTKPTVADVPYFCDISQTTDCKMAVIYGNNFVQSDNLKCHYTLIQVRYQPRCEKSCMHRSRGGDLDPLPRKLHSYRFSKQYSNPQINHKASKLAFNVGHHPPASETPLHGVLLAANDCTL